jgi:hypothetical protein
MRTMKGLYLLLALPLVGLELTVLWLGHFHFRWNHSHSG